MIGSRETSPSRVVDVKVAYKRSEAVEAGVRHQSSELLNHHYLFKFIIDPHNDGYEKLETLPSKSNNQTHGMQCACK